MLNFVIGAVAGALMAAVATIAALRNPDVQLRMGLVQPAPVILPLRRPEPTCPPAAQAGTGAPPTIGHPDLLFSRRRFWSVTP
ncbi:hypothetical protein [uncultured Methylobacterium sp.]|jgi:hypothetical protein|uniref:hypothetical protein n=1 Tax=uncultured Methylobacterium sp. TaxID=157278 RepID=UPI00262FD0C4|nr:hypothetical protein [uncultured Methylobacterium sp.]